MQKNCAIIVLYHPDSRTVSTLIRTIESDLDLILLIDNTPGVEDAQLNSLASESRGKILYQPQRQNLGIAEAQNIGIRLAIAHNMQRAIFFDQDSAPEKDMIKALNAAYQVLGDNGVDKVAAVGPRTADRDNGRVHRPAIDRGKGVLPDLTRINQLISSGSMSNLSVFNEVGLFESRLFIDAVDHEWCWRAKSKGYDCFIAETALMPHKFGREEYVFMGIRIANPSPIRCYYLYRNYFLLLFREYVPFYWKVSNFIKFTGKFFYYSLIVRERRAYFKNIIKGTRDGLLHAFK